MKFVLYGPIPNIELITNFYLEIKKNKVSRCNRILLMYLNLNATQL